jgi:hypothetical protein
MRTKKLTLLVVVVVAVLAFMLFSKNSTAVSRPKERFENESQTFVYVISGILGAGAAVGLIWTMYIILRPEGTRGL